MPDLFDMQGVPEMPYLLFKVPEMQRLFVILIDRKRNRVAAEDV